MPHGLPWYLLESMTLSSPISLLLYITAAPAIRLYWRTLAFDLFFSFLLHFDLTTPAHHLTRQPLFQHSLGAHEI